MRIEDGVEEVSASRNHLVFAYYVTGHGFGHATRVVEVVRHLILAGHDVHVVTGAPDFVFTTEIQSPRLFLRKLVLDCGAVQADALTVDRLASLEKYSETAVAPRASILATEVEWLNSIKADLVVSDVVAVACRAAADAGIRSVCVTNFSWDFIYAEYVMAAGYHHRSIVWQIAEDYSHCEFLIRLPGYCPMPAFRDVIDVPLVVRRLHKSRKEPAGWKLKEEYLPPGWLCLDTANGKNYASDKLSGARRLRDAIVLGYQLQRVPGRDISIPEWYASAENELGLRTGSLSVDSNNSSLPQNSDAGDFDILHGDVMGLPDTMSFLRSLAELDAEDIYVARAPGRLDVIGGIADYSGSLVLQMPIREACHVAVQKIQPGKQRLWKHAQARQHAKGQGPTPVLQIVSYGSELSNRGPTFDMDLSDFMDGDQPISYEKAKGYFARDPSQRWAAYVAGTILVLMKELDIRFESSISMLVSSAVPEGKGVSSSASVEVASMSAIAASHGLVDIPSHIRFWGIDSGLRHSIGGADYGSVRIGAFMGRKIIKSTASVMCSKSCPNGNGSNPDELEEHAIELLEDEASLDYLCNLTPHRFEAIYSKDLPSTMNGEAFLTKYNNHNDPVTTIDKKRSYGVKAATRHPIYENFRVKAFKALLTSASSEEQLTALGELMYQCHYSYSACGLGSDGTDRLVQLVQEMQHGKPSASGDGTLYGAKITGGGSGGTVCVIGRNCLRSSEQILQIQRRYRNATGYMPFLFEGSSPGAGKFGHLRIRRRAAQKQD
ncbi:Galactokinase galactose-binding domain-containing protein [Cynara cardunculus var. scolymus]|uniref:Galactokinase galactose-binding domain-containing protein n=1 Tax=Cynara cardunculus var. scolymus TaxID=59895 RepID=A0A103XRI0_CYNCS|nr:Galactokinase galactose-binding domain-containing protein [Cynara cardunculus var. scolymus]